MERGALVRVGRHHPGPVGLPTLAATAALVAAVANIASAVTPDVPARARLLLRLEPVVVPPLAHAAALLVGCALAVIGFYLLKRRRRAMQAALALLVLAGFLDVVKGLDIEEAALSWGCAGLLWWGRAAFCVGHDPLRRLVRLWIVPALWCVALSLAMLMLWGSTRASVPDVAHETAALLVWSHGPVPLAEDVRWAPFGLGALSLSALIASAAVFFRPLAASRHPSGDEARGAAFRLVREHGRDTLAFFKLRRDAHYHFNADRSAFLGYRVANGVMLIAGDPVGEHSALSGLVRDACAFAEVRGLRIAVLGASSSLLPLFRSAGLRALYLGDEAIVDTASFSLDGRWIRKVRQSVSRAEAAGYTAELRTYDELDAEVLDELEHVSAVWRDGAPERGFTMAMDSLRGAHHEDSMIVAARDGEGRVRAFIHFVPSFGRPAVSLSFMRRDHGTPNGLMEFVIVRAVELLRERGVEEVSLNFAAFARWLQRPHGSVERALGRGVSLLNPFFQIESLHHFNAKFGPRWEPRYLVYERKLGLPRVGLAALRIEGQLPKLRS